jgi:hypothetical protein
MANEFVARKGIISLGGLTFPYLAVPTNYTASTDDYFIDIISADVTVTLPTAVGIEGKQYVIRNSSTSAATINTTSAQTIDEVSVVSVSIGKRDIVQVVSNNTNWKISQSSGPIEGSVLNGVLVSDGTLSGTRANSGLKFNGNTLQISGQTSASTLIEQYALNLPGTYTATTAYTVGNIIFTYPLDQIISMDVDYEFQRTDGPNSGATRVGVFKKLGSQTGTTNTQQTLSNRNALVTNTLIYASARTDTNEMALILRATNGSEVISSVRINTSIVKIN